MTAMIQALHPDMHVIQKAQKLAYGGTTIAEQRAAWSAYTAVARQYGADIFVGRHRRCV